MILECSACDHRYDASSLKKPINHGGKKGWKVICHYCGKKWFLNEESLKRPLTLEKAMSSLKSISRSKEVIKTTKYLFLFMILIGLCFVILKYSTSNTDNFCVQQTKSEIKKTEGGSEITVFGEVFNKGKTYIKTRPIKITIKELNETGEVFKAKWKHELNKEKLLPNERINFQSTQIIKDKDLSKIKVSID